MIPSSVTRRRHAFTLVELLVVLAIIAVLASVGIGGLGIWKAWGVTSAGDAVHGNLALARELAISRNQPVELWFLQRKNSGPFVDAIQVRLVDSAGGTAGYDRVVRLPANVGIDTGTNLSPLLAHNAKTWPAGSGQTQPTISDYGSDYGCWYVRFLPDGSTTLSNAAEQYCTVHEVFYGNGLTALPKNYALLNVAPQTGKVTLYRP